MNKTELVGRVAETAGISKAAASRALKALTDGIIDELVSGGVVIVPGFGSFSVRNRAARTGRNPQTGQTIQIKASRSPKFKPGKAFKEAVQ